MTEPNIREKAERMKNDHDIEQIKEIIETMNQRYHAKNGSVALAGIDGGTVKIAPAGHCWR
jgi:hypothetical protein